MKHEKDESIELNLNCGHVWVLYERPLYRESMSKWRDIFVMYKHRASASEWVWWFDTRMIDGNICYMQYLLPL